MSETLTPLDCLYQGDTLIANLPQQFESDGVTPKDITGYTCSIAFKTSRNDPTELYSQDDNVLTDPVNGNHTFTIAAATTGGWPTGTTIWYDMQLEDPSGIKTTVQLGTIVTLKPVHN